MKILFFPSGNLAFHAKSLDSRPLGGMETAVIRLAEALSELGHRAIVVSGLANPPLSDPLYIPHNALGDIGAVDVLIAVREWKPLCLPIQAKVRCLWTGDSYDQPQNIGIGDKRIQERLDLLLPVSNWHKERLCQESGFPIENTHVLPNGIHAAYFEGSEPRLRKRLIYSSTPYRGLEFLPPIFRKLRERHSDAELHVFSGYKVYQGSAPTDPRQLAAYQEICRRLQTIPGVQIHGNVQQKQLAREFMKSSILAYPNSFEETSCITAMEAQAAGCAVVSSERGALPETVGDAGILIPGDPQTEEYQTKFLEALDILLSNDSLFETYSANALRRAADFSWQRVAQGFSDFLLSSPLLEKLRQAA